MAKNETGITDTGEEEDPQGRKVRRTTVGHTEDTQSERGDGVYSQHGPRVTATNYGRPALGLAVRRRVGMR